jgi:hypothetical protein
MNEVSVDPQVRGAGEIDRAYTVDIESNDHYSSEIGPSRMIPARQTGTSADLLLSPQARAGRSLSTVEQTRVLLKPVSIERERQCRAAETSPAVGS